MLAAGVLQAWDVEAGKTHVLRALDSNAVALCMEMSAYNKRYLAVGAKGFVYVLDGKDKGLPGRGEVINKIELNADDGASSDKAAANAVTPLCIRWDPLGANYALVAVKSGAIFLYDLVSPGGMQLMAFQKQPASLGLRGIAWARGMPGTFVSFCERTLTVRSWNASQPAPIGTAKLAGAGSAAAVAVGVSHCEFLPQSGEMVCALSDGSCLAWSFEQGRVTWSASGGHTETVFGAEICPTDGDMLATCSYDGTVRLWDARTSCSTATIRVSEHASTDAVLYGLSWSPDGAQLVTCANSGRVSVLDLDGARVVRSRAPGKGPTLGVAWCPAGGLIAAGSDDGVAYVLEDKELKTVFRFKHPGSTCGVDWNPLRPAQLAVGCRDANIYVWDVPPLAKAGVTVSTPRKVTGHNARVYGVRWSPLVDGLLLSSSDDKTARVHQLEQAEGVLSGPRALVGHTQKVRALRWHPEVPYLAVSGSWDSSLRLWDVRNGTCLQVSDDHHGDIYSVAASPAQPMVLHTCSRDSTVRAWDLRAALRALSLRLVLGGASVHDVLATAQEVIAEGAAPRLCSARAAELVRRVERMRSSGDELGAMEAVLGFVGCPFGQRDLWAMARKVTSAGALERAAAAGDGNALVHYTDALKVAAERAGALEQARSRKTMGVGAVRKEDALREAAEVYLKSGMLERYCELMAEVGDWDKALMVAPAVSQALWRGLLRRYVEAMAEKTGPHRVTTPELAPAILAAGDAHALLRRYEGEGRLDDAFLVATASSAGAFANEDASATASRSSSATPAAGAVVNEGAALAALPPAPAADAAPSSAGSSVVHNRRSSDLPPLRKAPLGELPPIAGKLRAGALTSTVASPARPALATPAAAAAAAPSAANGVARSKPTARRRLGGDETARVREVARRAADAEVTKGLAVVGAARLLAADDVDGAVECLLRGDELETAWALCHTLRSRTRLAVRRRVAALLSHQCVRYGEWELALAALAIGEAELPLEADAVGSVGGEAAWGTGPLSYRAMVCAAYPGSAEDASAVYALAGIEEPAKNLAAAAQATGVERAARLLLSRSQAAAAAEAAIAAAQALISEPRWRVGSPEVCSVLRVLRALSLTDATVGVRDHVLCLASYLGAFAAAAEGYTPVVAPMFANALNLAVAAKVALPVLGASLARAELEKLTTMLPADAAMDMLKAMEGRARLPEELRAAAAAARVALAAAAADAASGDAEVAVPSAVVVPLGAGVPSRARVDKRSALTGEPVAGPAVCLEDGATLLTRAEAAMWARCNAYSMLNSGSKINPH